MVKIWFRINIFTISWDICINMFIIKSLVLLAEYTNFIVVIIIGLTCCNMLRHAKIRNPLVRSWLLNLHSFCITNIGQFMIISCIFNINISPFFLCNDTPSNDNVNVASNISYRPLLGANVFAVRFINVLNNLINVIIGK
jgi:hypothetical protein